MMKFCFNGKHNDQIMKFNFNATHNGQQKHLDFSLKKKFLMNINLAKISVTEIQQHQNDEWIIELMKYWNWVY